MAEGSHPLPPKKEVALLLLEGPSVYVHLDPRKKGVVVPKSFSGQTQLVLQVGLNMAIPIRDLLVDDDGLTCTLSFSRTPFWCSLPWTAVYALVGEDGRGMVWPEDVPPELAAQAQQPSTPKAAAGDKPKRPRSKIARIGLAAVREPRDDEPPAEAPASAEPATSAPEPAAKAEPPPRPRLVPVRGTKRRRELPPYLRVVK